MTTVESVLTVPGEWAESFRVDLPAPQKVVGLVMSSGSEILVPDDPNDYMFWHGYSSGFSRSDVAEVPIILSPQTGKRLENFFKDLLIGERWTGMSRLAEKYDCHWFTQWLKGRIHEHVTLDETLDMSEDTILQNQKVDLPIPSEQIGVIGSLSGSYAEAYHSFVGVNDTEALHAIGIHGAVVLTAQQDALHYYRLLAQLPPPINDRELEVYAPRD